MLPPFLHPIGAPDFYIDTRTDTHLWLSTQEVASMYQQWQVEQQQQWQYAQQQRFAFGIGFQAQQSTYEVAPSQYGQQYHTQAPQPMYNFGAMDFRSYLFSSQQSGYASQNFGSQLIGHQQHATYVSQNGSQINTGAYNASSAQTRVQGTQLQGLVASTPIDLTANTVDLTQDEPTIEPVVTPQPTKAAAAPEPKPDPAFWNIGSTYLTSMLNRSGHSNQSFLFGSLMEIPSAKRNKYAAKHWPTREAAFEDITEMSQYFIDATEMLTYRLQWDIIEADLASGELSREKEESLMSATQADKRSLQAKLAAKRQTKMDRIANAQTGQWIDTLKAPEFERRFKLKATQANKRKMIDALESEQEEMRARSKARMAPSAKTRGALSSALTANEPKSKAGGVQAAKPRRAAKAKNKAKAPAPAPAIQRAPSPTSTREALEPFSRSPSPLWSKPGSADLEIIKNPSTSLRQYWTADPWQENLAEPVTAAALEAAKQKQGEWEALQDDMMADFMEEDTAPAVAAPAEQTEEEWAAVEDDLIAGFMEEDAASPVLITEPREENTVMPREQVIVPSVPTEKPTGNTEAVTGDEGYDSLFEYDA